jgi:cephalosporin-C deacetylase-like acetyl esterase
MGGLTIGQIKAYEKGKTTPLTPTGNANTGWIITGNLDNTKDDYFLIVHYQI